MDCLNDRICPCGDSLDCTRGGAVARAINDFGEKVPGLCFSNNSSRRTLVQIRVDHAAHFLQKGVVNVCHFLWTTVLVAYLLLRLVWLEMLVVCRVFYHTIQIFWQIVGRWASVPWLILRLCLHTKNVLAGVDTTGFEVLPTPLGERGDPVLSALFTNRPCRGMVCHSLC